MLIDLNHGSGFSYGSERTSLNARLNALIDRALVAQHEAEPRRSYLGASRIGEACSRRLVYEYTHTPHDPDKAFSGHTLRIFAAGQYRHMQRGVRVSICRVDVRTLKNHPFDSSNATRLHRLVQSL